jgi:hypothetical protein
LRLLSLAEFGSQYTHALNSNKLVLSPQSEVKISMVIHCRPLILGYQPSLEIVALPNSHHPPYDTKPLDSVSFILGTTRTYDLILTDYDRSSRWIL